MPRLICAFILVVLIVTPSLGQQSLVGTYKIVSFIEEMEGKTMENMGKAPHGYLIFTPTHVLAFYTTKERKPGTSMAEKAALFDTLTGWGGKYRIEGNKFIYMPDVSWTETVNGTTRVNTFELSGNRLTLIGGPYPYPRDPSKMVIRRAVWEKIE
jgi:hypothetical protein